jgi:hypothetical protein
MLQSRGWYGLLLFAGALALASARAAGAEGHEAQLQAWLSSAGVGLAPQASAALAQISGTDRQLLALRSYVRAADSLTARWSWSADRIATYPESAEGKAADAALDAVSRAFVVANPGYELRVNRQPRSLETQIAHWNVNPSVGRAAQALERALVQQFSDRPVVEADVLRTALTQWTPPPVTLAAPGLSAHGQARAFDFSIERSGSVVAGLDYASARERWDAAGWTRRLQAAVASAGNHFVGPLAAPYEPWHYAYVGGTDQAQ